MTRKHIIAFVGMPGSGKGTCTTYLHQKHSFPVVHFGNMVYEEVQRRGLDNVKDEQFVREDMREQEGKAVLAKHVARKADEFFEEGSDTVVLDGLYSWSELKFLKDKYGADLSVIAITAPRQERYRRILARKDSHRKYTSASQIEERDISEIENLEKGGPIAFADFTLANHQSSEHLLSDLDEVVTEILT
ncbi:MAG: AAA family ATPase [Candidatus Saccharimonadales bacterium]